MKITRRQLRQMLKESIEEEDSQYKQKLLDLIVNGDLMSAEMLAESLEPPIDLFSVIASSFKALSAVMKDVLKDEEIKNYLYTVGDGAYYEQGFFPTLLQTLPNFGQLCAGMSYDEIVNLINSDPENYTHYQDGEMGLGMAYPGVITSTISGGMFDVVKEWLIGLMFLKIQSMHSSGKYSNVSEIIEQLKV